MSERTYLWDIQYPDDTNLYARVELHRRFSVNSELRSDLRTARSSSHRLCRPGIVGAIGHDPPACLSGLTYQLIGFIADLVLVCTGCDAQLRAEVLAPPPSAPRARAQSRQGRLAAW